ncbi:invasion associated locus B family protein [Hyphomicrobium zavarzinii]|jgi:invasion protein IalB|uniref:invasion associated locus B family protein n=1 Tax=Hyphomicrobium zavarzinii TaxID=48292 RepID=UPI002355EEDE|nr:invasion associated locus B family protein [Hyphomicrobium zavarzinii]
MPKIISACLALMCGPLMIALAQSAAYAEPTPATRAATVLAPVSSDPHATSATYGDWVLVCQKVADEAGTASRLCEVSQSVQVQGQSGPIARLAISKTKSPAANVLTIVLPTNVLLTEGPKVAIDESDPIAQNLIWARCLPGGCFAEVALKDDVLAKWRAQSERGRLDFKDGLGRSVAVPFSFRGLAPAYDALSKE